MDLKFQLVGDPSPVSIVGKVLFSQPAARAGSGLGLKHGAQRVDDVALAGVVLADDHGQGMAQPDCRVKVAIPRGSYGADVQESSLGDSRTMRHSQLGSRGYAPGGRKGDQFKDVARTMLLLEDPRSPPLRRENAKQCVDQCARRRQLRAPRRVERARRRFRSSDGMISASRTLRGRPGAPAVIFALCHRPDLV